VLGFRKNYYSTILTLHHSIPSDPVHASALRRFRLVSSWEPIGIFTGTVAGYQKLRSPHILKLDLNGIAGIHGTQPLMKGAGGDNVSGIEPEKFC
jgi:hypothetical protein